LLRPRRFVELRVQNGKSFFAACRAARQLGLRTECIAIDRRIGAGYAGLRDEAVLDNRYIRQNYPRQQYIQSVFSKAGACFEAGSIDLLHIGGSDTDREAIENFTTWLPKMSEVGVIIFHGSEVRQRRSGLRRLLEELKARHSAYNFFRMNGLGIAFVGLEPPPSTWLRLLERI
jgi:hypothetical protein